MPIDQNLLASIAGGGSYGRGPGFAERQQLKDNNALRQLQLQQGRQSIADDQATRNALPGALGGDADSLKAITMANPQLGMQITAQQQALAKEAQQRAGSVAALGAISLASAPEDQREAVYGQLRQHMAQLDPNIAQSMPEKYDPGYVRGVIPQVLGFAPPDMQKLVLDRFMPAPPKPTDLAQNLANPTTAAYLNAEQQAKQEQARATLGLRQQAQQDAAENRRNSFTVAPGIVDANGAPLLIGKDGTTKPIPGAQVKVTNQKQQQAASAKLMTLNILDKQLANLKNERAKLGVLNQGKIAGLNPISEGGDNFDAAVAAIQPTIRQITRTPGEGAMSDYESRLAQAQLPSRRDFASSIDQKINQIDDLVATLRSGYGDMKGGTTQAPAQDPGAVPDDIAAILAKHGGK